jgi:putative ABC transport system permease protein
LYFGRAVIENFTGLSLNLELITISEAKLMAGIFVGGMVAAIVPAIRAYKLSLSDGLTIRT